MNVHAIHTFDREIERDLEVKVNDLARLTHAMDIVGEHVIDEIISMATPTIRLADVIEMIEMDLETLLDMIRETALQAKALRAVYAMR